MLAAALYLLALLLVWWLLWEPRSLALPQRNTPLLFGHRGVRGSLPDSLPENSLAAFAAALDAGLVGLETDLQRSADGVVVLYHDFALPDGRRVRDLSRAELQRADPNIPTLDALFTLVRDYPAAVLNLELKTLGWQTGGLERATARAVMNSGLASRVLVSSFNPLSLVRLRWSAWSAPTLRAALLYSPDGPPWLRSNRAARFFLQALHLDALHPQFSLIDAPLASWAQKQGVMLNAWTVNDAAEVKRLTRLNVNGLMADDPATLKDAVEEATWSLNS